MSVIDEVNDLKKKNEASTESNTGNSNALVETNDKSVKDGLKAKMAEVVKDSKDIKDLAKGLTYLQGASNLQGNDEFTSQYEEQLGKQFLADLKDEGKRQAIINASRKQEAKNIRAESFYNGCKPIFELLGIKEAYGLIPMLVTVILLMIPFLVVSLARFVFNSINTIATAVLGFRKPAMYLCMTVLFLVLAAGIIVGAIWGIDQLFGTHILPGGNG